MIEITVFTKTGGPLTKRISLGPDGKPVSDGSACVMSAGSAKRVALSGVQELADLIAALGSSDAIALGALRDGVPDKVKITTKTKLDKLNGRAAPDLIARTGDHITYRPKQPAYALLDYDTKGMPREVEKRIKDFGGFWPALVSVLPELKNVGRLLRHSTSAGLYRTDTGDKFPGSDGLHVYVEVKDGTDIERFLRVLHDMCWLAGLGWMMVGKGGQLLERSIVDRMVGAPERLVFEGAPIIDPPLAQDQDQRRPRIQTGNALDTIAACPPLTIVEQARLRQLRSKEKHRLNPEAVKLREAFIKEQADRHGNSPEVIARQCQGILLPSIVLPFDDQELAGTTVGDVLADPAKYEGATLSDPLEGIEYGACKAKIMRRADGTPWIHSYAHGRTTYELKWDAAAIEDALNKVPTNKVADTFVRLALLADLDAEQLERLRNIAAKQSGVGKRAIDNKLKAAKAAHEKRLAEEERNRRAAERRDPRPMIHVPSHDDPWAPQNSVLHDVLGKSQKIIPPGRDIDSDRSRLKSITFPRLHLLVTSTSNQQSNPRDDDHDRQDLIPAGPAAALPGEDDRNGGRARDRGTYRLRGQKRPLRSAPDEIRPLAYGG